jgi:holo-[acyl-carrier protein] synthase
VILRTGVDLIEVARVRSAIQRHGQQFLQRIYTPRELTEVGDNESSLAARFAAKEAVSKALGTGIGEVTFQDIEILRGASGEPVLHLHRAAASLAAALGLETWSVSLSHTQEHAIAMVVAVGKNQG